MNNDNEVFGSADAALTANITVNSGNVADFGGTKAEGWKDWTPINSYSGIFDGQGHTISGLYFYSTTTKNVGLFGVNSGTVQNVGVINSYFMGQNNVGGLCGVNRGTIKNCYNTSTAEGTAQVGGICGITGKDCIITNCYNTGKVSSGAGVCGFVLGIITNCYYNSDVTSGGIGGADPNVEFDVYAKNTSEFNSGEVAYLLQGEQTENVWGQTIGTDNYPVVGGAKVYPTVGCIGYANAENVTKEHTDLNGDEICDVCGEFSDGVGARLAGYTLSLNGNIGVNFYMELSDDIVNNSSAYMHFILPNGSTKDVPVSNVKSSAVTVGEKTCYVFPCEVAAKEMTADINAQIVSGDKVGTMYTYAVNDYADYILNHTDNYSAKTVALVKAMLNYGAYSQEYFGYNTGVPANLYLDTNDKALPDITADTLSAYAAVKNIDDSVCDFVSAYLSLKSKTSVNVYVTLAEGVNVGDVTFMVNGYAVTPEKVGDRYLLTVDNISAAAAMLSACNKTQEQPEESSVSETSAVIQTEQQESDTQPAVTSAVSAQESDTAVESSADTTSAYAETTQAETATAVPKTTSAPDKTETETTAPTPKTAAEKTEAAQDSDDMPVFILEDAPVSEQTQTTTAPVYTVNEPPANPPVHNTPVTTAKSATAAETTTTTASRTETTTTAATTSKTEDKPVELPFVPAV